MALAFMGFPPELSFHHGFGKRYRRPPSSRGTQFSVTRWRDLSWSCSLEEGNWVYPFLNALSSRMEIKRVCFLTVKERAELPREDDGLKHSGKWGVLVFVIGGSPACQASGWHVDCWWRQLANK